MLSLFPNDEGRCLLGVEIIDEGGQALQRLLSRLLNLDGKLNSGLDSPTQIGQFLQTRLHAHMLAAQHGLSKLHLVHAVVHHAL